MKFAVVLFALMSVCFAQKSSSEAEWDRKMKLMLETAQQMGLDSQSSSHAESQTRATGTDYFDVAVECAANNEEPRSIHHLRPQDIDVVGALGDSITAANGADADTVPAVLITYKGVSWSIGGDLTLSESLTLPNILRQWRPDLKGYSLGNGNAQEWFNAAVPGARANDMPDQARDIVQLMKEDNRTDFENDWKVITIFIGGNDLCALDRDPDGASPEAYIRDLKAGLDILHDELPRTLVQVAEILPIWMLGRVKYGFGADAACRAMQGIECGFVSNANETELVYIEEQTRLYQKETQDLISSGRYDTRDDFTVVNQPFFRNTDLPYTEAGEVDATFFAPDCFHFSSKGHALGAYMLWKNMLEPVGQKTMEFDWSPSELDCPVFPYIYTNINSVPGWEDGQQTNVATTTSTVKPPSSTEEPASPDGECPPSVTTTETPLWVIIVICVLAGALLLETISLLVLTKSNNSRSRKVDSAYPQKF